jgi:GntR family transcriptional regulator
VNIIVSMASKEPMYEQIKMQIQRSILSGELCEGDALPSIRALAKDLRVSVITTKKAYEELERERLITSHVGKGSFVAQHSDKLLAEKRRHLIERKLGHVIRESRKLGVSRDELKEMFKILCQEGT